MIFAKDSAATSWVPGATGSDHPLQNLPYGVFSAGNDGARVGVAIGEKVLDLAAACDAGLFAPVQGVDKKLFAQAALNDFMAAGHSVWSATRRRLVALLAAEDATDAAGETVKADRGLRDDSDLCERVLVDRSKVTLHLPCRVHSFVDFYSSKEHASNVGSMFRDPENPLLPNWLHIPIGYNGRASSVVVSGTDVTRPCGQTKANDADAPSFGPSRLLDVELEMGFFTGPENRLGEPIPIDQCMDHVFGMALVNDWSARDIQRWEYVPLGPFLGKSFATSVSPWVVPMEALAPFAATPPKQDPQPLNYLRWKQDTGYNINLEIHLSAKGDNKPTRICQTNFKYMYWTIAQQLAHLTSNGTNILPGDLYASGTVSGPTPDSFGSMLELCWRGTKPIKLDSGQERKFLQDGDTVTLTGSCEAPSYRVGFGEVTGTILPARVS